MHEVEVPVEDRASPARAAATTERARCRGPTRRSAAAAAGPRRLQQGQQLEAQLRAAEGELLGDQNVRRLGAQQPSSWRDRSVLKAASSGAPSSRLSVAQALVAGAHRRQLMEARAAQIERAAAPRPRPAARRSRPPPRCAPAPRRGGHGRCPAGAARERRRGSCAAARSARSSVDAVPSPCAEKKCRQRQSSLTGWRPVMSQPVASASRARIAALCETATTGSPRRGDLAVQPPRRSIAVRGDSPPGGWKSRPSCSAAAKALAAFGPQFGDALALPDAEAHLAQPRIDGDRRRGLHQLCGAPAPAATGCTSAASRSAGAGRRQLRAAASPAGLSGMSVVPCRRLSAFQAVGAWRSTAKGTPLIAAAPATAPGRAPPRASS